MLSTSEGELFADKEDAVQHRTGMRDRDPPSRPDHVRKQWERVSRVGQRTSVGVEG